MDLPDDDAPGLLANSRPGDNSPELTVSELAGSVKRVVEGAFGQVRVRGEISGFKRHASGHCYFTLKDDSAPASTRSSGAGRPERSPSAPRTAPKSSPPAR